MCPVVIYVNNAYLLLRISNGLYILRSMLLFCSDGIIFPHNEMVANADHQADTNTDGRPC